jgi:hypothetical protein
MPTNNKPKTEFCPACGADHVENVVPVLCHNMLQLAEGLREYLAGEDEQGGADRLFEICCDVLGEEPGPIGDDDDDDEFFEEN